MPGLATPDKELGKESRGHLLLYSWGAGAGNGRPSVSCPSLEFPGSRQLFENRSLA